jgi:hypothetical protein
MSLEIRTSYDLFFRRREQKLRTYLHDEEFMFLLFSKGNTIMCVALSKLLYNLELLCMENRTTEIVTTPDNHRSAFRSDRGLPETSAVVVEPLVTAYGTNVCQVLLVTEENSNIIIKVCVIDNKLTG